MEDIIERLPGILDVIDIAVVAVILYWLMLFLKRTRAERMLWGLAIIVGVYFVSARLEFLTLHWILANFLGSIVIFIIVVFQQDMRRALVQMGRPFATREVAGSTAYLEEISKAVVTMSLARTGALIAIERGVDLSDFLESGVEVDAELSRELLLTVFNSSSALHDGAVIVRDGRLDRAGCILPLTRKELIKSMGTRHRAGIGLSEETDAVVIIVSENSGDISIVIEERLEFGIEPTEFLAKLRRPFAIEGSGKRGFFSHLKSRGR
ncbi:MAG: diadenylate cyclase CdaA [Deltaproteobacteria bacterium]|nr:diadenylate cyclase CdaA [Deltaproteobacteria bacterium]